MVIDEVDPSGEGIPTIWTPGSWMLSGSVWGTEISYFSFVHGEHQKATGGVDI